MNKNNQQEDGSEQRVQTRYDRKMEARRIQEAKDKRNAKIMKISALVICFCAVAAIAASVVVSMLNKKEVTKDTYVKIGEHQITKLEYEYFNKSVVSNYLSMYSSMLPYMGLDVNGDFAAQPYSDTMSWKDMFDQMTVEQITQTKAILDDAAANQFTYDTTEDYKTYLDNMKTGAESAEVSLPVYYKNSYGSYATQKNIEPFVKEAMTASGYYQELLTKNKPADDAIKEYYEQNKQTYDKVDYRSFAFKADVAEDAAQEEIDKAIAELKTKADAMMEERKGGADFEELSMTNAAEEEKANYEDTETEYSLTEGAYSTGVPMAITSWLYEDARAEGDLTVIEDTAGKQVYVVEFVKRYFDEADNENISNTIASNKVVEYVTGLVEKYEVIDVKGELVYLTIEETPDAADTETDTAADTPVEGDAAATTETPAEGDAAATTEAPAEGDAAETPAE